MLKSIYFLIQVEFLLLWRRSQEFFYPLVFFLMLVILFPLALTTNQELIKKFFPGYMWIAALLASLLSIQQIFLSEFEDNHLEQLFFSTLPLPLLLIIKLFVQWLVTEIPIILITPLLGIAFGLSYLTIIYVMISLLLGTPLFTLIGSLGLSLTYGLRQQGVLLSVLVLPLSIPIILFGLNLLKQTELGISISGSCAVLGGLTLIAASLIPFAMAASLRFNFDD